MSLTMVYTIAYTGLHVKSFAAWGGEVRERMGPMEESTGHYHKNGWCWIRYRGPKSDGSWGKIDHAAKTKDCKKAQKLLDRKRREAANAREGIPGFVAPASEKLTFNDLAAGLEAHAETVALKSLRQIKTHLAPVKAFFGAMRALALSRNPSMIDKYIAKRRTDKRKDATIDRELELLRRCFTLAIERGQLAASPRVPKLVKGHANARRGFWEKDEADCVIGKLPSEVLRDVFLFGYLTGARRGEILSLGWSGYDKDGGVLRIHAKDAKTGRGRVIPLNGSPELLAVIARRHAARIVGCDLIFHNGAGQKVGDFFTTLRRAMERAKVRGRTFHDLRRTAVRNMIRGGVDPTVAKAISGHQTDSVFQRYNVTDERDLSEAMRRRTEYEKRLGHESGHKEA